MTMPAEPLSTTERIEELARGLTHSQRLSLMEGCGCDTGEQMVELGLWQPEFGVPSQYYLTTELGKALRNYLRAHAQGDALAPPGP